MTTLFRSVLGSITLSVSLVLAACGGGASNADDSLATASAAGNDSVEQRMSTLGVTAASSASDASSFTLCAGENEACSFSGTRVVRYGTATQFAEKTISMSTTCSNDVFGDPIPYTYKSCWYGATDLAAPVATASPVSASVASWAPCASENGTCTFTGLRNVRYGANATFTTQLVAGPVTCSNGTFGDPISGVVKACSMSSDPGWVECGKEGGACSLEGLHDVRYGTVKNAVVKQFTAKADCSNAVFGDPAVGTPKTCWMAVKPAGASLGVYLGAECKGAGLVAGYSAWLGRKPDRALDFLSNETWVLMEAASSRSPWCWSTTGLPM
ncbi:MAG: hypothetical protein JWN04_4469, partial [Myxococcaceae bacterium]|nr:hypothetical protein [Myxococcaceae bacterium]